MSSSLRCLYRAPDWVWDYRLLTRRRLGEERKTYEEHQWLRELRLMCSWEHDLVFILVHGRIIEIWCCKIQISIISQRLWKSLRKFQRVPVRQLAWSMKPDQIASPLWSEKLTSDIHQGCENASLSVIRFAGFTVNNPRMSAIKWILKYFTSMKMKGPIQRLGWYSIPWPFQKDWPVDIVMSWARPKQRIQERISKAPFDRTPHALPTGRVKRIIPTPHTSIGSA